MTARDDLITVTVAKLREQSEFLKHNIATWQLLSRAADEIERLREALSDYACPGLASCPAQKLKDGSCVNAPMGQCGDAAHAALQDGWA